MAKPIEKGIWLPVGTNAEPKDQAIDLWAKRWFPDTDEFKYRRFADCRWSYGDSQCNRKPAWTGLDDGWRPVAFMIPLEGPLNG